ncbi:hypothetical protein AB3662_34365 [Sorangium cellulosum]
MELRGAPHPGITHRACSPWPTYLYVTQTRARHRCPTRLLAVTIDATMAR